MSTSKRNKTEEDVLENIRWFIKFPLEKRFELSEKDSQTIKLFRKLKIKKYVEQKRSS